MNPPIEQNNNEDLNLIQRQEGNDTLQSLENTSEMALMQREEANSKLDEISRTLELQLEQNNGVQKVQLQNNNSDEDELLSWAKSSLVQMLRGPKGEKGDKGENKGDKGERGIQGEKGDTGEDAYTPIKGRDYFDGEKGEKGDTGPQGIQGLTGPQGEKGLDGKDGQNASVEEIKLLLSKPETTDTLISKLKDKFSFSDLKDIPMYLRKVASKTVSLFELDDVSISSPTNAQVLKYNSTTGKWENGTGGGGASPLTTKGDLYTYSTVDARLGVGTNGQVLSADSVEATGLKWIAVAGTGTVTSVATAGLISGGTITTTGTITTSMATNKLVGRSTAGTGIMEEITLGTGLAYTGTTLNVTSGAGTVTSVTSANADATVATTTTTPVITIVSAPKLTTGRTIGTITGDGTSAGSSFDGSANNTNALTLATVNSNVGSFTNATLTVNGKGLITAASSGTTPEVPLTFSTGLTRTVNTVTVNTSQNISTLSNLTTNGLVTTSGGTGALSVTASGTGVLTALGINVGSAGAFVTFNGALGTPSSGTVTNLTGTASININGTVGATTPTTGVFTTATATTFSGSGASLTSIPNSALINSAITINGTSTSLGGSISVGTVTSVTGTAPVVSSGGATPAISMAAATSSVNGYLTSTDWTTFNNKSNTNGTVTSVAAITLGTTGTDLSSTVATGTTTPVITLQVPTASATNRGALSSTDWTTFNNKQATLVSGTNLKTVNGTTLLGSGDLGIITGTYGGTGINNSTNTITIAGNLTHAGAFTQSFTATANTAVTLPAGATAASNNLLSSATALGIITGTPSGSNFLRGDGTWATPAGSGTVTSVAQSFTGGLISVTGSPITSTGTLALTVAGTSGGIPYFSSASTWATSAALAANALVIGGGAGVAPSTITTGTGVVTALGVNVGSAGAFVTFNGALGTPTSGTLTNCTFPTFNQNTTGSAGSVTNALTAGTGLTATATYNGSAAITFNATGTTINSQTTGYTLVATDAGKTVSITTGGVSIPNAIMTAGHIVSIYNNSGSSQTITQGASLTLQFAGQSSSSTGNRTLGLYGLCTIVFISSSNAVITGSGLT